MRARARVCVRSDLGAAIDLFTCVLLTVSHQVSFTEHFQEPSAESGPAGRINAPAHKSVEWPFNGR